MKFTALLSLTASVVLVLTDASPFKRPGGFAIPLHRRENFQRNTPAHVAKVNRRYNFDSHLARRSVGKEPLVNFGPDIEFYGNVSIGTPAQVLNLNFDTVSSSFKSIVD